jgi:hypothetical protein
MIVGCGLTIALRSFTGYALARHIAEVQREAAMIDGRYISAQDVLSLVRSQVLVGSVAVRDALVNPDLEMERHYRLQIEETYKRANTALEQYEPLLHSPAELERIQRLHDAIE